MKRHLFCVILFSVAACSQTEERKPTAAEVKRFTDEIDRRDAAEKAKAVEESRKREEVRDRAARRAVPSRS
jgi:hypothetical protein